MTAWTKAILAVAGRPWLWGTGIRQVLRLTPTGWWKHRPFLPLPAKDYLSFRMQTAYGDQNHPVVAADLVTYLDWCRSWQREQH